VLENKGFSMVGFEENWQFWLSLGTLPDHRSTQAEACAPSEVEIQKQSHCDIRRMDGVT
jgi:hypothetical protein